MLIVLIHLNKHKRIARILLNVGMPKKIKKYSGFVNCDMIIIANKLGQLYYTYYTFVLLSLLLNKYIMFK